MLVYPSILPATAKAFNISSKKGFNPKNDIVMSIEYYVSGNSNTEAGMSFFIMSDSNFSGGLSGADLCFSGFANGLRAGVSTALIGLGIDSTGAFGLSGTGRDGYAEADRIPNSIAVRGSYVNGFALSSFNYYTSLSSLSGNYSIIQPTSSLRTLRFRLGNVGRTLYLDYRSNYNYNFTPIAAVDIGDYFDLENYYRIGFGFTTSVSSNKPNSVANFNIRRIHVEGQINQLSSLTPLIAVWENVLPLWPEVTESWSL